MLDNTIFLNGGTVLLSEIGEQPSDRADAGSTLVCVTSNVNTGCCRGKDNPNGGGLGLFTDSSGGTVTTIGSIGSSTDVFYTVRYTQQLRLGKRGSPPEALGTYRCVIPIATGGIASAIITITDMKSTTVMATTMQPTTMMLTTEEPTTMKPTTMEPTTIMATTSEVKTSSMSTTEISTTSREIDTTSMTPTDMMSTQPEDTTSGPPSSGLYFMLGEKIYIHQDRIPLSDIGGQPSDRSEAGSTLVCVTSNVNRDCCRGSDNPNGGGLGKVTGPMGDVPGFGSIGSSTDILYVVRFKHQLRLGKVGSPMESIGTYTCIIPGSNGFLFSASIIITGAEATTIIQDTMKSTTMEPTTLNPTTMEPTTMEPTTMELTSTIPSTMKPTTMKLATTESTTMELTSNTPTTVEPATTMPSTVKPTSMEPTSVEPNNMRPITRFSTTSEVGTTSMPTTEISVTRGEVDATSKNTMNRISTQPEETTTAILFTTIHDVSTSPPVLPPLRPSSVNAIPQTTSVTLTWIQSSQNVITDYIITYISTDSCSDASSGSKITSGSPYTITDLEEGVQYQISIVANNSVGMSPSADTTITTLSAVPSCCIPRPVLQSLNATSFTVTWDREPCLHRNGAEQHYEARYYFTGSSDILNSSNIAIDNRRFTVTSINSRTSYTFEVALVNVVGIGPYSSITFNTPSLPLTGYLGSVAFSNNSVVDISDIGEDDMALVILSNVAVGASDGELVGRWRYPNGDIVSSNSSTTEFFTTGSSDELLLHRPSGVTGPNGIYTCEIFGINDNIQELYFGLYTSNEGVPVISSLVYNTTTGLLTCISSGGPAANVIWNRNGPSYQQNKIVVDTITATYHNFLVITSSQISDYTGIFTCTVMNRNGRSSNSTGSIEDNRIIGFKNAYEIGSSARVVCYSNFSVTSIKWTSTSSNIVYKTEEVGEQEAVLIIEDISKEHDDAVFFCDVVFMSPSGITSPSRKSFTINIEEDKKGTVEIKVGELGTEGNTRIIIIGVIVGAAVALTVIIMIIFIIILVVVTRKRKLSRDKIAKNDYPLEECHTYVTVETTNAAKTKTTQNSSDEIPEHESVNATENGETHSEVKPPDDDAKELSDIDLENV